MMLPFRYILAFGSNVGNRRSNCDIALAMLRAHAQIIRVSRCLQTQPLRSHEHDTSDHGEYLNFVAEVRSWLAPHPFYQALATIEDHLGHARDRRWAPRAMDIDILRAARDDSHGFSECTAIILNEDLPGLCVPHRELSYRHFWHELLQQLGEE